MKRLLQDRLVRGIGLSMFLCILIFAGVIGYQRWRFVQRAYAEAARFGYTEENFLVAEEHCGDPWILFIPPQTCYLTIYFTTDLTRDQLVQLMEKEGLFGPLVVNGEFVSTDTLVGTINMHSNQRISINDSLGPFQHLHVFDGEDWGFHKKEKVINITYWPINPKLVYKIDGKIFQKNIIGVGLRR